MALLTEELLRLEGGRAFLTVTWEETNGDLIEFTFSNQSGRSVIVTLARPGGVWREVELPSGEQVTITRQGPVRKFSDLSLLGMR